MSRRFLTRHRVKELAQERDWSMTSLAYRSGIDTTTVRKIYQDPHYEGMYSTWARLAKAFDIPLSELVFEDPQFEAEQQEEEEDQKRTVPAAPPSVRRRAGVRKDKGLSLTN